jgi:hypothetical protein
MGVHVLIVATRYDNATYYIHEWAARLRDDLLSNNAVSSCIALDGESLCHSGTTFADAVERADFVVFYGHGEIDHWIAMPQGSVAKSLPLVDVNSVNDLRGRQTYAACCYSLTGLGRAFANAFPKTGGKPEFIGYSTDFNFLVSEREQFRRIIHYSVRDFILGRKDAATIVSEQQAAWLQLEAGFSTGGMYSTVLDANFAAGYARKNACVGYA